MRRDVVGIEEFYSILSGKTVELNGFVNLSAMAAAAGYKFRASSGSASEKITISETTLKSIRSSSGLVSEKITISGLVSEKSLQSINSSQVSSLVSGDSVNSRLLPKTSPVSIK